MKSVEEYYYTVYTHCNIFVNMCIYVNMLQHLAVSFMLTCTSPTLSLPKICMLCYTVEPVLKVTCEGWSPCIRRSVLKVPKEFSMGYIHIEHLYKQATCI